MSKISNSKISYFRILFLILSFMLVFRYGQGTDYFDYYYQFEQIKKASSVWNNILYHGELGWYILMYFSYQIGFNFELFVAFISLVMLFSLYRAIKLFSPYKITSLLILYPTYYLTYCFSALRQGLVMSLFLGFGLDLMLRKKMFQYFILIIILTLFHKSALLLVLLPVIVQLKDYINEKYLILGIIVSIIFKYTNILNFVASKFDVLSYLSISYSINAILLRIILFFIIYKMHHINIKNNRENNELENILYKIYLFGFIIFITLSFSATLSQRLTMPFKAVEILLIPINLKCLLNNYRNKRRTPYIFLNFGTKKILLIVLILICFFNIETYKNIHSYIEQGNYYEWVNIFNYPYCSIFNKEEINRYKYNTY